MSHYEKHPAKKHAASVTTTASDLAERVQLKTDTFGTHFRARAVVFAIFLFLFFKKTPHIYDSQSVSQIRFRLSAAEALQVSVTS